MSITKCTTALLLLIALIGCKKSAVQSTPGLKVISSSGWNYGIFTFLTGNGACIVGIMDSEQNLNIAKYDNQAKLISARQYKNYNSVGFFTSVFLLNGNLVVCGFNSAGNQYFASMFDMDLDSVWNQQFNFNASAPPIQTVSGCASADGNIYMAVGLPVNSASTNATVLIKLSSANGNPLISPAYINSEKYQNIPAYISANADGIYLSGYYLYYYTAVGSLGEGSGYCMKIGTNANKLWNSYDPIHNYGGDVPFNATHNIAFSNSGAVISVGVSSATGNKLPLNYIGEYYGEYDFIGTITATIYDSATGNISATKTFSIDPNASLPIICSTPDNGFIIAATGNWSQNSDIEPTCGILIKTDAQLNVQWQKKYNNIKLQNFYIKNIIALGTGYEMLGLMSYKDNNRPYYEICIINTDLSGNLLN